MVQPRQLIFPGGTLFFRIDGAFFALLEEDRWLGIDDEGRLLVLSGAYAAEVGRMIDIAEMIGEEEFCVALADDAAIPSEGPMEPPPPRRR